MTTDTLSARSGIQLRNILLATDFSPAGLMPPCLGQPALPDITVRHFTPYACETIRP